MRASLRMAFKPTKRGKGPQVKKLDLGNLRLCQAEFQERLENKLTSTTSAEKGRGTLERPEDHTERDSSKIERLLNTKGQRLV